MITCMPPSSARISLISGIHVDNLARAAAADAAAAVVLSGDTSGAEDDVKRGDAVDSSSM